MTLLEDIQKTPVAQAYRQGWLAWLGTQKTAYEFLGGTVPKFSSDREAMIAELVAKGEDVEAAFKTASEDAKKYVEATVSDLGSTARNASDKMFKGFPLNNDAELIALKDEVAKLNKNVSALTKKLDTKPAARPAAKAAKTSAPEKAAPSAA